jgi:hypothetical protein
MEGDWKSFWNNTLRMKRLLRGLLLELELELELELLGLGLGLEEEIEVVKGECLSLCGAMLKTVRLCTTDGERFLWRMATPFVAGEKRPFN